MTALRNLSGARTRTYAERIDAEMRVKKDLVFTDVLEYCPAGIESQRSITWLGVGKIVRAGGNLYSQVVSQ